MVYSDRVNYMRDFEAKEKIISICKDLSDKGYIIGEDGSISVRVSKDTIWITPKSFNLSMLTLDKLLKINLEGKFLQGSYKLYKNDFLPEELSYHINIYKENSEIASVIHSYPPNVIIYSMNETDIEQQSFSKPTSRLGKIPYVSLYGNDDSCVLKSEIVNSYNGVILKELGCFMWGENILKAYSNLDIIEYTTKILNQVKKSKCIKCSCKKEDKEERKISSNLKGVTKIVKP
ncbi:MAG: class II aldolase/adducin family protein [Lachnospirales bacterium]